MTSTQESTRPIPFIGQAVGQAQASLTKILLGILAESGTGYQDYLGLQRLTTLGGEATREAYERDLSDWLSRRGRPPPGCRQPGRGRPGRDRRRHDPAQRAGPGPARGRSHRLREDHRADAGHDRPRRPRDHRPDAGRDHQAGPGDTGPPDLHRRPPMTTQKLPGTDAARHGTGDADLTIMIAAHRAFRRDLAKLVRAAAVADLDDPAKRESVAAGWELFKHELHLHHTAEDELHLAGAAAAAGPQRERPVRARCDGGGTRAHRPAARRGGRRVRAARRDAWRGAPARPPTTGRAKTGWPMSSRSWPAR